MAHRNNGKRECNDPESDGLLKGWCNTLSKKVEINYKWTIDDFSFYSGEFDKIIKSSNFGTTGNKTMLWCLKTCPGGKCYSCGNYIPLYVELVECNIPEIKAKIKFSILNNKGEKTNISYLQEAKIFNKGVEWGFSKFISKSFLQSRSETLLPDDKLTLFCEMVVMYESVNTGGLSQSTNVENFTSTFVNDIGSMLDSGHFFDCIVKVGDDSIKVHKDVLSSRSSVFKAMFVSSLSESQSSIIEISDFRYEVVREMINYIYKDSTSELQQMAIEILAIADKYNLEGLKTMAEQSLCNTLDIGTVLEYFKISEMYAAKGLKRNCLEFLRNNAPDIINTDDWNAFVRECPELVTDLCKNLLQQYRSSNY
uniref:BTB domain-containing protein n=1 Tax=Strongyloides papillosus TaxID=174720 RepID=A0A0N5CIH4_STREA